MGLCENEDELNDENNALSEDKTKSVMFPPIRSELAGESSCVVAVSLLSQVRSWRAELSNVTDKGFLFIPASDSAERFRAVSLNGRMQNTQGILIFRHTSLNTRHPP